MGEVALTFTVDGLLLGLPVARVEEVLRRQRLTRVPLASDAVGGLLNLRGQIVLAVDLRRRLGSADPAPVDEAMHVVVRAHEALHSLLVDGIGDVVDFGAQAPDRVPERVPPQLRDLATRVYRLPDRLVLMLDVDRLVDPAALAETRETQPSAGWSDKDSGRARSQEAK
jgi:purine-binding chemotaxis protein CheW